MRRRSVIVFMCAVCILLLGACANSSKTKTQTGVDAVYDGYVGYTFTAIDPWGGDAFVQVEAEDDHIICEYTDYLTDKITFVSNIYLLNGDTETEFEMSQSEDDWEATYQGTFAMKDGTIVITFSDGQMTRKSEEGGSGSHQVGALEDNLKTVVFKK